VMSPVEFLGRLAILVPPPYFPLVRYHGVFAARSKWRALVTLKPPGGVAPRKKKACPEAPIAKAPLPREPAVPASTTATPPVTANGTADAATSAPNVPPSALAATALAATAAPAPVVAPPSLRLTASAAGRGARRHLGPGAPAEQR